MQWTKDFRFLKKNLLRLSHISSILKMCLSSSFIMSSSLAQLSAALSVLLADIFSSANSLQKIEKIQERALRFLYNDQLSSYDVLLSKSGRCTVRVFRLKFFCALKFSKL